MNWGQLFAYIQIGLAVAACIGYLCAKDYRRATYWACAAGLTTTVTVQ